MKVYCRRQVEAVAMQNPIGSNVYCSLGRQKISEWLNESLGQYAYLRDENIAVYCGRQLRYIHPGEWVVYEDGDLACYTDKEFRILYSSYVPEDEAIEAELELRKLT